MDKDKQIEELTKRIAKLEKELSDLEKQVNHQHMGCPMPYMPTKTPIING